MGTEEQVHERLDGWNGHSGSVTQPRAGRAQARPEQSMAMSLWVRFAVSSWLALELAGCAAASGDAMHVIDSSVSPERDVCGWEELRAGDAVVTLSSGGTLEYVPAGVDIALLAVAPDVPYGDVGRAIEPAKSSLVRIKIVVGGRWLVSLTYPATKPIAPLPAPAEPVIVGYRKITRDKAAPRQRMADIRLNGERARLYVEGERAAGREVPVAELADVLRRSKPPIEIFALTAAPDVAWRHVERAALAAACHDRRPGEEPHEVIVD